MVAKALHPHLRGVSVDQRGIDGADRYAGNPVERAVSFKDAGIHASLISTQRTAPLQHQRLLYAGDVDSGNSGVGV